MKLETFFEKFDQFADAPNAVAKMRDLVLQLAVTGKLVKQDKRDEPASVLLESMESERARFVAVKKIKSRPSSPVESDEQPFDLPSSWEWARLSNVGYELGQKVPDKRFTYIDVGGIDSDKGRISDRVEKLEAGDAPSRARKLVARGTVIYSTVRPYLLNIAIVDQDFDPEPIASTAFGILHPFEGINNRYLFYWLRSAPFTEYVQAGMKGMAYPAINDEKFYTGPIAIPPLAEQKRIVAKVDELMALCDRLETQQQERETQHGALARASLARFADKPTPANLQLLFHPFYTVPSADLRKSILTLAVQGKLVPQDPNDEPADELVARVEVEKRRLVQTKEIKPESPLNPISDKEVFKIPDTWTWIRAGQLCRPISSGSTPDQSVFNTSEGIPYLKVYNIRNQTVDFEYKRQFIALQHHEKKMKRSTLLPGDVIMNIVGPPLGKVAIVPDTFPEWNCNQAISFFRPILQELAPYLYTFLKEGSFLRNIQLIGTAGQDNISVTKCKYIPIALPPLAEQRRIVAKVEQLMILVDELEAQLTASRTIASKLLEAVVAELTTASLMSTTRSKATSEMRHEDSDLRLLLSAYLMRHLTSEPTFGRTKHAKLFYLSEHIARIDALGSTYRRKAAGPLDISIYDAESELQNRQWFETIPRSGAGASYRRLNKSEEAARLFEESLSTDQIKIIKNLITETRTWTSLECEKFATVYAAWNDLIIKKLPVGDEAILDEILNKWHPDKAKISSREWIAMIRWVEKSPYRPTGFGQATVPTHLQPTLL